MEGLGHAYSGLNRKRFGIAFPLILFCRASMLLELLLLCFWSTVLLLMLLLFFNFPIHSINRGTDNLNPNLCISTEKKSRNHHSENEAAGIFDFTYHESKRITLQEEYYCTDYTDRNKRFHVHCDGTKSLSCRDMKQWLRYHNINQEWTMINSPTNHF